MDFEKVLSISAAGLEAQRIRINVIASNLANANSTRSVEGGPYRRKDVVFSEVLDEVKGIPASSVEVSNIIEDKRPFKVIYNPHHPDADEKGYVKLPNVNVLEEMVNLISATRSYEANVNTINTVKHMAQQALQIGR